MAFYLHGDARDATEIIVLADANDPTSRVTSLKDQAALFEKGEKFAAATARATMIDGLALHYLLMAEISQGLTLDPKTRARLTAQRITLGQINEGLKLANGFHEPALALALSQFVQDRNHVAHHLAAGSAPFDLDAFFKLGRTVAIGLWRYTSVEINFRHLPP
jgi:hypothetical protein